MKATNSNNLQRLFQRNANTKNLLSNTKFFMLCRNLQLWPKIVQLETCKRVLVKDSKLWPEDKDNTEYDPNAKEFPEVMFNFKDFIRAFELMSQSDTSSIGRNSIQNAKSKVEFFAKLNNLIQRHITSSVTKQINKGKSPIGYDVMSGKSTPEVMSSTGAAQNNNKKAIKRYAMNDKRSLAKKKTSNRLTDANTIANVYVNKVSLRKALIGIDKKTNKFKNTRKLKSKAIKTNNRKRGYKMIDLTMNQHDIDDDSDFNFTTEGSLPPLERSSQLGSENGDGNRNHERYSRSHERAREPEALQVKNYIDKRSTANHKNDSNNNSIIISENAISLAASNNPNNRSDLLSLQRDLSYENSKAANKKESFISKNTSFTGKIKGLGEKINIGKAKETLKLRKFSKSDQKVVLSSKSNASRHSSRKSRVLSNASSKGKMSIQEMSQLRFENERYKHLLTEMVAKFNEFKAKIASQTDNQRNSSESGSSIVWKDRCVSDDKAGKSTQIVNIKTSDDKDRLIEELQAKLAEKDKVIYKLRKQVEVQKHLKDSK